jgi:hypothetical protein
MNILREDLSFHHVLSRVTICGDDLGLQTLTSQAFPSTPHFVPFVLSVAKFMYSNPRIPQ